MTPHCWRCGEEYAGPGMCLECRRVCSLSLAHWRRDALPVGELFPDLPRRAREPRVGEVGELFGGSSE